MYTAPQKKFRARDEALVLEEIRRAGEQLIVNRVFLADGDALVLPTRRLLTILQAIREYMPEVRRVSSYCLPRNLGKKSVGELKELADAGLKMAYVGCESGDDEVLARVNKGETFDSSLSALDKLGQAGITRSVMILNGLGGQALSAQHADNSARLMNEAQPEYLSTLVVSFPMGEARFRQQFADYQPLTQVQLFTEVERLLQGLELQQTVFRSDHASIIWCSRVTSGVIKHAFWLRCAVPSSGRNRRTCVRNGSVGFDLAGAESASASRPPDFRHRRGGSIHA